MTKEFVLTQSFSTKNCRIDYEKELNAEQLDVVLKGDGPCLVLAGAGSGKTRTITYRVAYLLENGVAPENILLVTFTNKAAREMITRVEGLLGSYPTGLWAGTFHSVANRILRRYASALGYTPNFTILDQDDAKTLIKAIIKELKIDTSARRFPSAGKLHGIISYARNASRSIEEVVESRHANFLDVAPLIDQIAQQYDARKRGADAMDFDDLLLRLQELFSSCPDIADALAQQFQYVLVDEYQDTNVIQAGLVKMLASVHQNLLVVGDDAQSIYSFRAAEIRNILQFPDRFEKTQTFQLVTNYRSTPEILNVANASISQNAEQFKKALTPVRDSDDLPSVVAAATSAQEAQYIAQQILELRDDGMALQDMAVLFRAAFHSQALEFELMKRDIPYEYRGGMKFFERAHVKDVVSYLRVIANYRDETAWMRILGLQPGIGLVTAQKIIRQIHGFDSLAEAVAGPIKVGARGLAGWKNISTSLTAMQREELPADLIRSVVGSDYRDYIEAEYQDFMDRLDDLEQFALFAEGYTSLTTFLDEVSLTSEYGSVREEGGGSEERIILSTIHQAKGLEWDAVFVMSLSDGKFPNPRALEEAGGLEEERRLFYVATTRARKRLFYTYPITSGYDTLEIGRPSVFLDELPAGLTEEIKLKVSGGMRPQTSGWASEDPVIVLDDYGETGEEKPWSASSFLRGLDEL